MNKGRRTKLRNAIGGLQKCYDDLDSIKYDEDDARENIPENLQGGDAYSESEQCSETIEDALSDLQGVIDSLESI